jgi:hypothetical protein
MAFHATPQPIVRQAFALTRVNLALDSSLEEPLQGVADAFDRVR